LLTAAVHIGFLSILLWPGERVAQTEPAAMALFVVPPAPAPPAPEPLRASQPKPVPPTPPQPIIVPPPEVPLPLPSPMVVALLEQADTAATGGACDLTGPVQAALQSSEAVWSSLPRIPRGQRSVANAIMVWNADWSAADAKLDATAMATIRDVVAGTVAAASPACRLQHQGGPRLIVLTGARENTVLAMGSGMWRWQDLLDTARLAQGGQSLPVEALSFAMDRERASIAPK
jgi:hypothetical protein